MQDTVGTSVNSSADTTTPAKPHHSGSRAAQPPDVPHVLITPGGRSRSVRRPFGPLSVRSSFCVVTFTIAVQEDPGPEDRPPAPARPPIPKRQSPFSLVRRPDPVRPRLCAYLQLVYRSVRRVRTRDCPAVHCVKARPSHRRSIACAALRSLAGAFRRARDIRREDDNWPVDCGLTAAVDHRGGSASEQQKYSRCLFRLLGVCQKWTAGTLPAAGGDGSLVHTSPTGAVHVSANVDMGAVVATIDAVLATNSLPELRRLCKDLGLPTRNAAGDQTLSKEALVAQLRAQRQQLPVSGPAVAPSGAPTAPVIR